MNPPKTAAAALSGWPSISAAAPKTASLSVSDGSADAIAIAIAAPATAAAEDDPSPLVSGIRLTPWRWNGGREADRLPSASGQALSPSSN